MGGTEQGGETGSDRELEAPSTEHVQVGNLK